MGIICAICSKKQSGWIEDFPLTPALPEQRICADCKEKLVKLASASSEKDADTIEYFETHLKTDKPSEVREYLLDALRLAKENLEANRIKYENIAIQRQQEEESKRLFNKNVQELMLTTGNGFEGYKVEKYIDVICEEVVFKNSFWKQFSAGLEDFGNALSFASREMSGASELIANAREYVMQKFKERAVTLNANAVLGIDLENSFGSDVVRVSVFGTAVRIKKTEDSI